VADSATAARHPSQMASGGMMSAPSAPPNGNPTCLRPTTVARWRRGNQAITALAVVGLSMP
jgi:hypothetical protein